MFRDESSSILLIVTRVHYLQKYVIRKVVEHQRTRVAIPSSVYLSSAISHQRRERGRWCSTTVGRTAAGASAQLDSRESYIFVPSSAVRPRGARLGACGSVTCGTGQGSSYGGGASRAYQGAADYHASAPAAQPPGVHAHPHHAPKHFNANEFNKEWPAA